MGLDIIQGIERSLKFLILLLLERQLISGAFLLLWGRLALMNGNGLHIVGTAW